VRNNPEYLCIERKLWSPGLDPEDKHRSHGQREVDGGMGSELSFDLDSVEEGELMMNEKRKSQHAEEDVDRGFAANVEAEEQDLKEGNWI
jgi:hypothetical protein